jgi:4-hydroxy-3-methylbut-2-enyl diphosphate reductase
LVQDEEEAMELKVKQPQNLTYVSQTTLSLDDTNAIVSILYSRFPEILKPKSSDICYATQNRQDAVKQLALEAGLQVDSYVEMYVHGSLTRGVVVARVA